MLAQSRRAPQNDPRDAALIARLEMEQRTNRAELEALRRKLAAKPGAPPPADPGVPLSYVMMFN